ncbi:putative RNA-directed DNA polymerase [Rosa chinensis]|uniref:Putative RNA-directed DNA polymerase n=1 Tax=Rosa chinensis TaxID=74649 RepID=A0A2P6RX14_ROSCH|nr:putative RNA-directed DNA polymerase [Rosa chinensis]
MAERKHRHIIELTRTLFAQSSLPFKFWVEVVQTSVFLINRLPASSLNFDSPFQKLFHNAPDYYFLKSYGCACYPWLKPYSSHKFDSRSRRCVFIGYGTQHKGYRCLDPVSGKVYISRHVTFDENTFPFQEPSLQPPFHNPISHSQPTSTSVPSILPLPPLPLPTPIITPSPPLPSLPTTPTVHTPSPPSSSPPPPPPPPPLPIRRPRPPAGPPTHNMQTRLKSGISKPKAFITKHPFVGVMLASSPPPKIPNTFLQASKDPNWVAAMKEEIHALHKTSTWTLVPPHSSQNLVGSKWIFRIKQRADGTVDRYKARLVAQGFHQKAGLDYSETFSPVAKPTTIRVLLSMAVQYDWPISQLDVSNAFLHGHLQETVYMAQPPGFVDPQRPDYVCQLHKSLYGLKQAPRAWYEELHQCLLSLGFSSSTADSSLFVKVDHHITFLLVYVDDIILTGNSPTFCQQLVEQLNTKFAMKNLGPLHYFLGLEVIRTSHSLFLHQSKYTYDLLARHKMLDVKPTATPESSIKLDNHSGEPLSDPSAYRSMVGALQYLTWTRPDIAHAVSQVCQHMHHPRSTHLVAVKRIFRYLKGTPNHGLTFTKGPFLLTTFSDADWAGCPIDRRSTTGYCVFLGNNLISWSAKKQSSVSRSSTEAEYRALALSVAEVLWLCYLFRDLRISLRQPPSFYCDNVSSIALAANPVLHSRTKHVDIDYHFIREPIARRSIQVHHVSSSANLADIFTKSLSKQRFCSLTSKLIAPHPRISLRGDNNSNSPPRDKACSLSSKVQSHHLPYIENEEDDKVLGAQDHTTKGQDVLHL